jgi:hypothetical protein
MLRTVNAEYVQSTSSVRWLHLLTFFERLYDRLGCDFPVVKPFSSSPEMITGYFESQALGALVVR